MRRALQQKYRYLFVDEFQDTDPVQAEIVFLLGGRRRDVAVGRRRRATRADWRTVPLRPGALFVVGDPEAVDLPLPPRRHRHLQHRPRALQRSGVGRVLPLTMNFRSVPALCDWANDGVRDAVSRRSRPRTRRGSPPLDPNRTRRAAGGVFTLTHACDKATRSCEQDAEQDRALHPIRSRCRPPHVQRLPDPHPQEAQPHRAVCRGARGAEHPDRGQRRRRVRRVARGRGAHGAAARAGRSAGSAVARRRAARPAVRHQRSRAVRLQAGRRLVQHLRRTTIRRRSAASRSSPSRAALGAAAASTTAGRACCRRPRRSSASSKHTGYLALAATTPGGVEAGDLLHAVDRVRQVVEDGGSLADAAEALEADREATSEVESLPLEPGRTDVVRVMNLHKAKGLEAASCSWPTRAAASTPRVDVHIERHGLEGAGLVQGRRKSEGSYAETLLGEHADWADARGRGAAVSRGRGGPPALRRRHPRARAARRQPVDGQAEQRPAWGVLNDFLAGAQELSVPRRRSPRRPSRRSTARLPRRPRRAAARSPRTTRVARSRPGRSRRSPPRPTTSRG